jgi:hypothetical protein
MSDVHELLLALDLPVDSAEGDLALLRWHLGEEGEEPEEADAYPLFSSRGPAHRIGGACLGELARGAGGWALTVRQEVHPDEFDQLRDIVEWLARRTTTSGTIGYVRHLEQQVPDVLVADPATGAAHRLTSDGTAPLPDLIPDPWS